MAEQTAQNGPRMLRPTITRNDYFESHDYTLTIADSVTVRLTDRQARDLYQQLHEEFKPKATLAFVGPVEQGPRCVCGHEMADHRGNYSGSRACDHCACPCGRVF